jgi:hypothetical protein
LMYFVQLSDLGVYIAVTRKLSVSLCVFVRRFRQCAQAILAMTLARC